MRITRGLGGRAVHDHPQRGGLGLLLTLGVVSGDALGPGAAGLSLVAGLFFATARWPPMSRAAPCTRSAGAPRASRATHSTSCSFIAGWAILLDYLIVLAAGAVVISDYLAVFWSGLDDGEVEIVVAGARCLRWPSRTCAG